MEHDLAGAELAGHLVRDRGAQRWDTLMRCFFASSTPLRIASGISAALPMPAADAALVVADDDQRAEAEVAAALDDLGNAVDGDELFFEFADSSRL